MKMKRMVLVGALCLGVVVASFLLSTADADMVVTPSGNVGIGTENPSATLEVTGSTKLINPSGRSLLIERNDEDSWLTFQDTGNYLYSMGIDRSDSGKFKLNSGGNVGDYNHFTVTTTGDVGIGTASPGADLHIYNPTSNGKFHVEGPSTYQARFGMISKGNGASSLGGCCPDNRGWEFAARGDSYGAPSVNNDLVITFWNGTSWITALTLDSETGKVIVGAAGGTGQKLYVYGDIYLSGHLSCPDPPCETSADYVFDTDYNLRPIEEVETFVKENKHLPNIPSAKEIEDDGLLVTDMFNKHLEKIEELTLYVIQLKKENQALKEALQLETEDLKKRLATLEAK
jgi:hypothetical protein